MKLNKLRSLYQSRRRWVDIERFDPKWKKRIESMAKHIQPDDRKVLDIGCGPMWLKEHLPANVEYAGIDYKNRGAGCIVSDLNKNPLPATNAHVIFISGCLEYIQDPYALIKSITESAKKCILSYCTNEDFPDSGFRSERGWVNSLNTNEIIKHFNYGNMSLTHIEKTGEKNTILVFSKTHLNNNHE